MDDNIKQLGTIFISHHAIATIAFQSALESYGVVGLADKNLVRGLSKLIFNDLTSGIVINYENHSITIDMYIIVEFGTRISSVAKSVADSVKFQVEKIIGLPVSAVNVHVRGLRVSNTD